MVLIHGDASLIMQEPRKYVTYCSSYFKGSRVGNSCVHGCTSSGLPLSNLISLSMKRDLRPGKVKGQGKLGTPNAI